ncbi:hypothetical protein HK25_00665 [Acetobacter sp. DsW_059]|nr:hypothetical protein HK25_00665 [Acetobacter sp. DsW_059]
MVFPKLTADGIEEAEYDKGCYKTMLHPNFTKHGYCRHGLRKAQGICKPFSTLSYHIKVF